MLEIRRILVANRGEIAVRVIRACRDLGIESIAVFSDADREALHVRQANSAYRLGPAAASDSYLNLGAVLAAAKEAKADAVHPGYGFLSENPEFAAACRDAGLVFIGPEPEVMALVGDKNQARRLARTAGVPIVPGSPGPLDDAEAALAQADELGYPVLLKATAGGGGKGMRAVASAEDVPSAFRAASSEAQSAFGDGRVYMEKVIESPRHIEIQILGDNHGNRIHLGERECSLQRRHQKVVEEAPSPVLAADVREAMGAAALAVAEAAEYTSAGTVEFLLDEHGNFYFIEVNARLQVEHPVTEMITGIDLVASQIAIAAGERLELTQEMVRFHGHAIECRIYAEDPARNFAPAPGLVEGLRAPGGPGIRDDSCLYEGYEVPVHYDPMVAKLIAWGSDRDSALARMRRALSEYRIVGISTTVPLFQRIMDDPDFVAARFDTGYLDRLLAGPAPDAASLPEQLVDIAAVAAALHAFLRQEARAYRPRTDGTSAWKAAGRNDALRGSAS